MNFLVATIIAALTAAGAANAQRPATGSAGHREPDWWVAGTSVDGDVTFLDANTLVHRGPTAMALTYTVYDAPDGAVKSVVAQRLFYCAMRKSRRVKTTFFDSAGKQLRTEANGPMEDAPPNSFIEDVVKFACGPVSARSSAIEVGSLDFTGLNSAAILVSRPSKH